MKDETILKKAIEKAKKNGWGTYIISVRPGYEWKFIFSHSFAKTFWVSCEHKEKYMDGECKECSSMDNKKDWQLHLQRMVLEEEPLKYLEKFLEIK